MPYTIMTTATSGDSNYHNIAVDDVSVTNSDDDTAGIMIAPTAGLTTTETGGTAIFTVTLTSQPTQDVTIDLSSSNEAEGTVAPASLTFTNANWNTAQTVTVTGVDDPVDDGDVSYTIITAPAISEDTNFSGVNAPDVSVLNLDNDSTPVAVNNAYITNGEPLIIPAPGILNNDIDLDGQETLSAILETNVTNGSLILSENGAFEYTPVQTFNGDDYFTYRASDGTNSSNAAEVKITVDRVAPTDIEWISPVKQGGQIHVLDEIIQLEANAKDNVEIDRVRFYRWDPTIGTNGDYVDIGSAYTQPYRIDLDTSTLNYEFNQIFVRAYDTAGNASERIFIWIIRDFAKTFLPIIIR
jgi:hypothetical protein